MENKKDKLDIIFDMQKSLDDDIVNRRGLHGITREEWVQKEILAIISELSEILDEVNFKWWKNPKEVNERALKEEMIDVLHFFVSMCSKAGMTLSLKALMRLRRSMRSLVARSSQIPVRIYLSSTA